MKKKHLYMIAILTATLSVITGGSVKRALFFDTQIAYADPTITYVYGTDGSEHAGLNNFYPRTRDYANPSDWTGSGGVDWGKVRTQFNLSKKALNACRVVETHCEPQTDNLCLFSLTGTAIVTPEGRVCQLWNNPY